MCRVRAFEKHGAETSKDCWQRGEEKGVRYQYLSMNGLKRMAKEAFRNRFPSLGPGQWCPSARSLPPCDRGCYALRTLSPVLISHLPRLPPCAANLGDVVALIVMPHLALHVFPGSHIHYCRSCERSKFIKANENRS